jgi:hypothetical protein
MRIALKIILYVLLMASLWWLLPQIAASFNRATEAASADEAARGYALFAIYLVVGAALASVVAWDVSRLLGEFAGSLFVGGGRLPNITPVLWKADRLRTQGRPQAAVDVLREHLKAHPRQWFPAVRIAELYQQSLNDPSSAALEYEEILKQRLPRSARAEIMLRLASCQLLLRSPEQSATTMREVIHKFPKSPAAAKAQRRLMRIGEMA